MVCTENVKAKKLDQAALNIYYQNSHTRKRFSHQLVLIPFLFLILSWNFFGYFWLNANVKDFHQNIYSFLNTSNTFICIYMHSFTDAIIYLQDVFDKQNKNLWLIFTYRSVCCNIGMHKKFKLKMHVWIK